MNKIRIWFALFALALASAVTPFFVAGDSSDPEETDSDGDGLSDLYETQIGTDPLMTDTDGDGVSDFTELANGLDPLDHDTDGDGIPDGEEFYAYGAWIIPLSLDSTQAYCAKADPIGFAQNVPAKKICASSFGCTILFADGTAEHRRRYGDSLALSNVCDVVAGDRQTLFMDSDGGYLALWCDESGANNYAYDGSFGGMPCEVQGDNGHAIARFSDGRVVLAGGLLAVQRGGAWHFPLYGGGGNITAYIDESGNVAATYAYGPYGETVSHTGQDFDYRFSTKPYNEVLNTYRFAYREYAPDTGRWLSQDPIFERGGHNLYAYCGNDPVNGYDPLGLFIVRPVSDSPRVKTNKFGGLKDLWASFAIFSDDTNDDFHGYILHKKYVDIRLLSCKDNTPVLVRKEMLFKRIRIGAFRMGSVYNEFIPEQPKNVYVNLISLYNLPECVHGRIELRATFQHYASSPLVFGEAVNDSLSGSVDYKHNNSAFQSYSGWPKSPKGSKDFSSVAITVKVGCESFDDYAAGRNLDSGYSVNRYERDEDKNGSSGYNWYENE